MKNIKRVLPILALSLIAVTGCTSLDTVQKAQRGAYNEERNEDFVSAIVLGNYQLVDKKPFFYPFAESAVLDRDQSYTLCNRRARRGGFFEIRTAVIADRVEKHLTAYSLADARVYICYDATEVEVINMDYKLPVGNWSAVPVVRR